MNERRFDKYVTVVALIDAGISRQYELPLNPDETDRKAFLRWLFDMVPSVNQRTYGGRCELYTIPWASDER